uniref:MttB n=1 Tax=Salix viminalis TaxID=40686 RepID=A0A6N2NG94_SALVM
MQKAIESSRARANPRKSYSKVKGNKMPNPGKLGAKAYQFPSKGNKGGHQTNSSLNGNSLRMPQDRISKSTSDWIPRGEVRIRSVRILIGLGLTWFTRYWFPEELISPLAKPFLTLPLDSYFVCTQSTEAFPTYVATCYGEQRTKYNRFLHLSGFRFSLFLFLTPPRVVPNVWHFPYFVVQHQQFAHDQVPVIVIRLPEPRGLSVETSTNNRRFLIVFPLLTAALFTPPDIWCQIVARFLISLIIELAIFVASIVQVREEVWTSGMRGSGSIDKKEKEPP